MQCSESAKPVKAVWREMTCTVKAKLDFVKVTKLFQNVNIFGRCLTVEHSSLELPCSLAFVQSSSPVYRCF